VARASAASSSDARRSHQGGMRVASTGCTVTRSSCGVLRRRRYARAGETSAAESIHCAPADDQPTGTRGSPSIRGSPVPRQPPLPLLSEILAVPVVEPPRAYWQAARTCSRRHRRVLRTVSPRSRESVSTCCVCILTPPISRRSRR
jgi:hypothetical protein